jgi:thioesterase domain-containing protein
VSFICAPRILAAKPMRLAYDPSMTGNGLLRQAEAFLHEKIPITRAMGVRVTRLGNGFAVEAPVALNSNHLQTGFGGSINAVATLAGYALLWLELRDNPWCHVVVRESSIRFFRPVHKIIRAICVRPAQEEIDRFKATLVAKDRARLTLKVRIEEESKTAAEFEGTFVALKNGHGRATESAGRHATGEGRA